MTVVFQKSKPSVLQLGVVSRAIYNDINQALCKKFNETSSVLNSHNTHNVKQWVTFHHGVIPEIKAMETQIEFKLNSRTKTTKNLMFSCVFTNFLSLPLSVFLFIFKSIFLKKKTRNVHISKMKLLYFYQENRRQHPTFQFKDDINVTANM